MGNKRLPENKKRQTIVFTTTHENIEKLDTWIQELKKENFFLSRSRMIETILIDYLENKSRHNDGLTGH